MAVAIATDNNANGNSSTATVNVPASISTGDLLVAWIVTDGTGEIDPSTGGPTGWTNIINDGASNAQMTAQFWYKYALLADESATDYSWTLASGEYWNVWIGRITGADGSMPYERWNSTEADSTSFTCPALNPRTDSGLMLGLLGVDGNQGPYTKPTSMTQQYQDQQGGNSGCCNGVAYMTISTQTDSTGAQTWTGGSKADEGVGASIIINPSVGDTDDGDIVVGDFTSSTDGSNTVVTIGDDCHAIIFTCSGLTTNGLKDNAYLSVGFAVDGGNSAGHGYCSEDNLGTTDTYTGVSRTYPIYLIDVDGTALLEGSVSTWGSTSITITWNTYDGSNAYKIGYVAFCGGGIDAAVLNESESSGGAKTYAHGLAVVPTLAFSVSSLLTSATIGAGASLNFGWATDNFLGTPDNGVAVASDDNVSTTNTNQKSTGNFVGPINGDGVDQLAGAITDWDATNVSVTFGAPTPSGQLFSLLVLGGVRAASSLIYIASSDTGVNDYSDELADTGVDAQAAMFVFGDVTGRNCFIGAAESSTVRWAAGFSSDDNVATSDDESYYRDDHCVYAWRASGSIGPVAADMDSIGLDSLSLDVIANPTVGSEVVYVILLETKPYTASTGTDVVSTLDTISLTKYNTTINRKRQAVSGLATLSLTSYNSIVAVVTAVTSNLATLSLTSYNSAINAKKQVVSGLGSLSLASFNTTVQAKKNVVSTLDTLSFASYNSTVLLTQRVESNVEALSFTAYASVVGLTQAVTSNLATLSFTSYNSTVLLTQRVESNLTTLAFTSYNTEINRKRQAVSGLATLTLASFNTTINAKKEAVSNLATLSLTSYNSTVSLLTQVFSNLATLSFTSYNTTINAKKQVVSGLATLSFTAYNSTVTQGFQVISNLATMSFASFQSSINAKKQVVSGLSTLSLTPFNTEVQDKKQVVSTLDTLSFAAFNSEVQDKKNVQSNLATLSFAAYATDINAKLQLVSNADALSFTAYNSTVQQLAAGFFRDMKGNLDGLGSGGPFFKNPLG